jgi:glycerol-3-phosphate acyltransferase PlsY
MILTLTTIIAYLSGSVPSAIWVGRMVRGIDIREHGSGNMGATNVARVLGLPWALLVAFLDIAKGFAPAFWLGPMSAEGAAFGVAEARLVLAAAAIVGHLFPLFAGFKGGKGVLTAAGAFLAMLPLDVGIAIGVWMIVFAVTRIVSVGSLAAATTLVASVMIRRFALHAPIADSLIVASVLTGILVFVTHRANIKRLIAGTESAFKRGKTEDSPPET